MVFEIKYNDTEVGQSTLHLGELLCGVSCCLFSLQTILFGVERPCCETSGGVLGGNLPPDDRY